MEFTVQESGKLPNISTSGIVPICYQTDCGLLYFSKRSYMHLGFFEFFGMSDENKQHPFLTLAWLVYTFWNIRTKDKK